MRTEWVVGLLVLLWVENGVYGQAAQPARGLKAGLTGEYFNGPNFERKVLTRTDPAVDFDWNWQLPGPGVQREYFSVRWTGKLYAPKTGRYRFSATVDDGVRVWVNGRKVIDEWRKQDDSHFVGEISLKGHHLYDLRIEYYNDWKGSVISVFWELPDASPLTRFATGPRQIIHPKYLFTAPRPMRQPVRTAAAAQPVTRVIKPGIVRSATVKRRSAPVVAALVQPAGGAVSAPAFRATISPEPSLPDTVKAGDVVVLRHVRFAQSDYTLLPASYPELDKVVSVLRNQPGVQVEVAGHTDNVGDKRLNQALSENRAKVVASYLVRRGIADSRIRARGYGGTRPLASNDSDAQRALNRRVELIVN